MGFKVFDHLARVEEYLIEIWIFKISFSKFHFYLPWFNQRSFVLEDTIDQSDLFVFSH